MRVSLFASVLILVVSASVPAHACMTSAELVLGDVEYADVVVVGRITNYSVVAGDNGRPGSIFDYARFDVQIDEVLKGEAPSFVTVTWDNSTFAEPDTITPGQYLVALRSPKSSRIPPLRGPSATIMPTPDRHLPTVLQAPCSEAFIFATGSEEAAGVRTILGGGAQ